MLVITCPGQGAQTPGMLSPWMDLPGVPELLNQLSETASLDLVGHGSTSDDETIKDTAIAQPLLVAAGLVSLKAIFGQGEDAGRLGGASLVAGHSVGEFTAAAATGVLSTQDAMNLVALRGREMAHASALTPTGMSAVLGGDPVEVQSAVEAAGLTAANVNGAGQVVAAGSLEHLSDLAAQPPAKARVIPLKVAGAFHTSYMEPAMATLRSAAEGIQPGNPSIALVSNRDGELIENGHDALTRLIDQVISPVRWDLCMAKMADLGVTGILEVLPGGTLAGLAKRTLKGVEIVAVKSPDDIDAARALAESHAR